MVSVRCYTNPNPNDYLEVVELGVLCDTTDSGDRKATEASINEINEGV